MKKRQILGATALLAMAFNAVSTLAQSAKGQIVDRQITSMNFADNRIGVSPVRKMVIYLPPGYLTSTHRYPVIYFLPNPFEENYRFDFDHRDARGLFDRAIAEGMIKDFKRENAKIIFQAKSGHVKRGDIGTLRGDMSKFKADMAIMLTLEDPTAPMMKDAKAAGQFNIPEMAVNYDRISIVTIKDMVEGNVRLQIPMSVDVLKKARGQDLGEQLSLL